MRADKQLVPAADVNVFGLVIAWLYTGKHDARRPARSVPGPPAIDRMLDRMLVVDQAQRMSIDEIVHELHALAR